MLTRDHAARQRGWVAIVGILLALVVVAVLAQTVLKSYGLISASDSRAPAGSRAANALAPAPADPTQVSPAPIAPLERARGLEREVQRDAQDLARRIDDSTK
jgi:hypothetical protein